MGAISFASDRAQERFNRCKRETERRGDRSLQNCIDRLKKWSRPITIGCDFDELSFTFREDVTLEEHYKGVTGVNGGIIYHGARDGFGSGEGPTFSVCMEKTEGYQIHT